MIRHTMVADMMTKIPLTVFPETKLSEVYFIMMEHLIRHLPVVDHDGELEGIISHKDLVRSALYAFDDLPFSKQKHALDSISAAEVMTTDSEALTPYESCEQAARLLLENRIGCVPVISGAMLVGIITEADFVALYLREELM